MSVNALDSQTCAAVPYALEGRVPWNTSARLTCKGQPGFLMHHHCCTSHNKGKAKQSIKWPCPSISLFWSQWLAPEEESGLWSVIQEIWFSLSQSPLLALSGSVSESIFLAKIWESRPSLSSFYSIAPRVLSNLLLHEWLLSYRTIYQLIEW